MVIMEVRFTLSIRDNKINKIIKKNICRKFMRNLQEIKSTTKNNQEKYLQEIILLIG